MWRCPYKVSSLVHSLLPCGAKLIGAEFNKRKERAEKQREGKRDGAEQDQ